MTACNAGNDLGEGLVDSSYCDGGPCDIALDTLARLGHSSDSISPALGARAVRMSNGAFLVAPTDHPGVFAVYSADGRLLRTFGKAGRGPDEYDTDFLQLYRRGDSTIIVDVSNLRLTVVDSVGNRMRSHAGSHSRNPIASRISMQHGFSA